MTEDIQHALLQAIDKFIANESNLLSVNANERAISSKLAEYMRPYFEGWDIDCEYNRLGKTGRRKLIDYSEKKFKEAKNQGIVPVHVESLDKLEKSGLGVSVYPDIIVHHRTQEFGNLLIVEIKKTNNPDVGLGWDEFKIRFFIEVLNYQAGAFITFNTGDKSNNFVEKISWFL